MAARLSALRASRTLHPNLFIFKDSWYIMWLEELGQLKKSISSGLEPATFQLAA
jgi:hypothetical protein